MKRKHDENVIYTEDEGVIDNCQFHVKMEVIIQECLEKADKAFTNDDGTRKMTETKFRKLFEFERAETEMVQNINRSMSAFMKKNEQKAMRNFIELSSWRMN